MDEHTRVASIAELKARLSHYLGIVRRGDRVLVTHRGRAVATLEPLPREYTDDRTAALVAAGRARGGSAPLPADFWNDAAPHDPEGRALSALLEERGDSR